MSKAISWADMWAEAKRSEQERKQAMNDLRIYVDGRLIPVKDVEMTVEPTGEVQWVRTVVAVSPLLSPDGSHRHVSRRQGRARELVALDLTGELLGSLRWENTDEVSECRSGCSGDHETWFVQRLVCSVCGVTLQPEEGGDLVRFGTGADVLLRFTFLDERTVSTEIVVHGLAPEPVTVQGQASGTSWLGRTIWTFEGQARVHEIQRAGMQSS